MKHLAQGTTMDGGEWSSSTAHAESCNQPRLELQPEDGGAATGGPGSYMWWTKELQRAGDGGRLRDDKCYNRGCEMLEPTINCATTDSLV